MRRAAAGIGVVALVLAAQASAAPLNLTVEVLSSSTTTTPPTPPPVLGGGGGGGGRRGSEVTASTSVAVSGRAYPLSRVVVLKDGGVAVSTIAGPDAAFSATLTRISAGTHTISVYAEDDRQNRSTLFSFPIKVTSGATTAVGGIFLSPTIGLDKAKVRQGDPLTVFGRTAPHSDVTLLFHSAQETAARTRADGSGAYLYSLDTTFLEEGDHTAQSRSATTSQVSPLSQKVSFAVGAENVVQAPALGCGSRGDVNCDVRINLVDYSVLAYWYRRDGALPSGVDLNGDGAVTLVDFSILAFYWTG